MLLDRHLCLSTKQIGDLKKLYSATWNPEWNEFVGSMISSGNIYDRSPFDSGKPAQLREVLSARQMEVFELLDAKYGLEKIMETLLYGPEDHGESDPIRNFCNSAMEMKLAEYQDLVGISKSQMDVLKIGRKGAIANVVDRAEKIIHLVREDSGSLNPLDFELIETLEEPAVSRCTKMAAWRKTLGKALDEDQISKIDERESHRKAFELEQVLNSLVFSLSSTSEVNLGLDYDQHVNMVALLKDAIDGQSTNYTIVSILMIGKVPDKDWQELLTDEQWQRLEPMLSDFRTMVEIE